MSTHDSNPATAGNPSTANHDPADISAYVPAYCVPCNRDYVYRAAKISWLEDHPNATSEQIELAFRRMADALGL